MKPTPPDNLTIPFGCIIHGEQQFGILRIPDVIWEDDRWQEGKRRSLRVRQLIFMIGEQERRNNIACTRTTRMDRYSADEINRIGSLTANLIGLEARKAQLDTLFNVLTASHKKISGLLLLHGDHETDDILAEMTASQKSTIGKIMQTTAGIETIKRDLRSLDIDHVLHFFNENPLGKRVKLSAG